jgi:hypothetical protein
MMFERTGMLRAARSVRILAAGLALLVPLSAAPGCGSKPPPPPGAEKETGLPEIDLGSGTETGEEAKSELSHGSGKDGVTPDTKDDSAAPDATGKPDAKDDADSTDEDTTDSEKESTATKG